MDERDYSSTIPYSILMHDIFNFGPFLDSDTVILLDQLPVDSN